MTPLRKTGRRASRVGALALLLSLSAGTVALSAPLSTAAPAKRPNLAVQTVTGVPEGVEKGGRFAVGAFVVNQGAGTAPPTRLTAYLSRDTTRSGGDLVVGDARMARMRGFTVRDQTVRVAVPQAARGSYHVLVCADATRRVAESSERDNCGFSAGLVTVVRTFTGRLSGGFELTDVGTVGDGVFEHTWERSAQVDLAFAIRGREGDRSSFEVTDTGGGFDVAGSWDTLFDAGECTVLTTRDETGSGTFGDDGSDVAAVSFPDSELERLHVAVVFGYDLAITQDLCEGSDTWQDTVAGGVDIDLEQTARSGRRITYRVRSFAGSPAETGPWDAVTGTMTLRLDG